MCYYLCFIVIDHAYTTFLHHSFLGVKSQIEYIKTLGVDSIWLSPFYQNKLDTCPNVTNCDETNQNYDWDDVTDHKKVGSRFGSEKDLNDLLAELKKHGNSILYSGSINLLF